MAHTTVLLQETIDELLLHEGAVVLDGTFGGGGHSKRIASIIGSTGVLVAMDQDARVFDHASVAGLKSACQFHAVVENFRYLEKALHQLSAGMLDAAVFDLGLSSTQLEESGRGFSFLRDEPLEMTFCETPNKETITAATIVNSWSRETLTLILKGFGEERYAWRIAGAIVDARSSTPITTTTQLVEIIRSSTPFAYHRGKTHFATRTFQALRMAVNDELGAITDGLGAAIRLLRPGGRMSVISFHSVEDRAVKQLFVASVSLGEIRLIHKKPIVPTDEEIRINPRARSAKLRVIEKLSTVTPEFT